MLSWEIFAYRELTMFLNSAIYLFFSSTIPFHCCSLRSCDTFILSGDWYLCLSCWISLSIMMILFSYNIFRLLDYCWLRRSLIFFLRWAIYWVSYLLIFSKLRLFCSDLLITSAFCSLAWSSISWLILLLSKVFSWEMVKTRFL